MSRRTFFKTDFRKHFIISWPQAVVLLFIAGTIIFRPVLDPWRIAAGGLRVVLVAVGIGVKLHYERAPGQPRQRKMNNRARGRTPVNRPRCAQPSKLLFARAVTGLKTPVYPARLNAR